ncbi:MAG: MBOAT family protein [Deltaproteobacteria bacterium]|nr:MBOAT family protein [Deltaproteobacteria bacterium]
MLFNSLEFILIFMPLVLGVARILRGNWLLGWISASSLVFYAFAGHAWFLVPMAVSTTLDFWVGHRLERSKDARARKRWLALSVVANLGLLAYFKYAGLFLRSYEASAALFGVTSASPRLRELFSVVLPAGISFYTFQTLSYVIDIYRRHSHAEKNFLKYLSFVAFFPHLVAGPLTRHNQLIPQLSAVSKKGIAPLWKSGLFLFSIGLIKKVLVADRIAQGIDPMIDGLAHTGALASWVAMVGYSLQIYFDFSGYSDMAIGLGRLFSIELPQNFNSPYRALNPSDFWRRWHITLSQWLRDYLYISLGGNRCSPRRVQVNLMLTMVLGGLWHGANWTFAIWGAYHGLLLVTYHHTQKRWDKLAPLAQQLLMYVAACFGWVFFRSRDLGQAASWFAGLAGRRGLGVVNGGVGLKLLAFTGAALLVALLAKNAYERNVERWAGWQAGALGLASGVAVVLMNFSSKFLYFQF